MIYKAYVGVLYCAGSCSGKRAVSCVSTSYYGDFIVGRWTSMVGGEHAWRYMDSNQSLILGQDGRNSECS